MQGQAGGAFAGGGEVHVGEGSVRGDRVGVPQHAAGEVGMQVEGQHDSAAVAEIGAYLLEEVSLGIVLAVRGCGPVQVEDEDVERHGGGDPIEQGAADLAQAGGAQASGGRAAESGETGGGFPAGCGQYR